MNLHDKLIEIEDRLQEANPGDLTPEETGLLNEESAGLTPMQLASVASELVHKPYQCMSCAGDGMDHAGPGTCATCYGSDEVFLSCDELELFAKRLLVTVDAQTKQITELKDEVSRLSAKIEWLHTECDYCGNTIRGDDRDARMDDFYHLSCGKGECPK